ncbi:hypothetical protein CISIN_1g045549mg, partial [Citrus sinensis]
MLEEEVTQEVCRDIKIQFGKNSFDGIKKLPWKNLEYLDFRSNLLQGLFLDPSSNMKVFLISNNRFTREIPCLICNLSTIEIPWPIPETLSKGSNLRTLNFNGNELVGSVPRSLLNCENLQVVDLGNNKIEDILH